MRVAQVPHVYRPHVGGVENHVFGLKRALERKGHEVTVYTTDYGIEKDQKRERGAVYCKTDLAVFRNPLSLELIRILQESSADVYHFHSPWFFTSLLGSRATRGRPRVMTVHGARVGEMGAAFAALNWAYRPLAKRVLGAMDAVIALTRVERNYLVEEFGLRPGTVYVIPNGVDAEEFARDERAKAEFAEKYGLREDSFKVLFVGRLLPHKNPDKLVSAIAEHLRGENVEAILVGKGDAGFVSKMKAATVGAGVYDRVHIVDDIAQGDQRGMSAAYHSADLFVLPSSFEGLPITLLEAMASGLPVLATPVGGIPDVIEGAVNGEFLDTPASSRGVARGIRQFIDMGASRLAKMGRANAEKVSKHYNWDSVGDRIAGVYEDVLAGGGED